MEQQEQSRREAEPRRTAAEKFPRQHERSPEAGAAARILLEGGSAWELPARTLEELAARVGNSGMLSLLKGASPGPDQVLFQLPEGDVGTVPSPVPPIPCAQAAPSGLVGQAPFAGPAYAVSGLRG